MSKPMPPTSYKIVSKPLPSKPAELPKPIEQKPPLIRRTLHNGKPLVFKPSPQEVHKVKPKGLSLRTQTSSPHIIVDALAGTGKTFTIIESAFKVCGVNRNVVGSDEQNAIWDAMSECYGKIDPTQIYLTAFGSSIAAEFKSRAPVGVGSGTIHSLGKRILAINGVEGARTKYGVRANKTFFILADILNTTQDGLFAKYKAPLLFTIKQYVGFCKLNLMKFTGDYDTDRQVIKTIGDNHGSVLPEFRTENDEDFFLSSVLEIYKRSSEYRHMIDFDDMLWLPWQLSYEIRPIELMYVDERQDLNMAQQELVCRYAKRLVLVGDTNQAIYGFAGADIAACERMEKRLSGPGRGLLKFPLTFTRRCGKAIVEYNRSIVPSFGYFPDAPDGEVRHDKEESFLDKVQPGDMVVCRTNAPLFQYCLQLLKQGRPFRTTVKKFFEQTINLIKSFEAQSIASLEQHLSDWRDRQLESCTGPRADRSILINDQYAAIRAGMSMCSSPNDLIQLLQRVFKPEQDEHGEAKKIGMDVILLTSIHQAKGLERPVVWWAQYDLVPHPKAKLIQQETNLKWVAGTRAINCLVLVKSTPKRKDESDE